MTDRTTRAASRPAANSRRKFIKRAGGGALAAAASTLPALGESAPWEWTSTVDLVCVGAGMGGCAAAIAGHDKGLRTLLLEKRKTVGGVTSQSAGILWVPLNHMMKAAGREDSREEALQYLEYLGAGYAVPEYMETFVDHSPRVLEYLQRRAGVDFRLSEQAEFYHPSRQRGRLVRCGRFPAETLGSWRSKVQLSIFHHGLSETLVGLEHDPSLGAGAGPSSGHSGPLRDSGDARLLLWRKWLGSRLDPLLRKDEESRVAGAALAAFMIRAVLGRGLQIRTETNVEELLFDDGRVVGITVTQDGQTEHIRAMKGVVLATGPGIAGWRLAVPLGAALSTTANIQGRPMLSVPRERYPDGSIATRRNYELRMRHGLVVNRFGERFGNEFFGHDIGSQTNHFENKGEHRFRNIPSFLIFDSNLLEKYSFAGRPPASKEDMNWVTRGDSLAILAQQLNLPGPGLEATAARFNQHAQSGRDLDFQRDPISLGAVEKAPFYGVELVTPDPFQAETTLIITASGQVVDHRTEEPIPGLYACGATTAGSRIWGIGYQAGYSLMACATFGFLAAEHAALDA